MNVLQPYETEAAKFRRDIAGQIGGNLGQGAAGGFMSQLNANRENESIERLTGKDLSGLSPDLKKSFAEKLAKTSDHESLKKALVSQGVPEQEAELYAMLTQGGQTAYIKDLLDQKKRQGKASQQFGEQNSQENQDEEFDWESELGDVLSGQDQGLTPAERVARGKERYASGSKIRSEATSKLRGFARNKERFDIMESLNKKGNLPKDFERINVDSYGNLRFPFAASADAERFVKVLNEFSENAKDTYGSRITNFDLSQYLKRFPTLLNSEEGRRQILQQMKIVNDINSVYYKNLDEVYRKAGGARNIDSDLAEDIATRRSEPIINKLSEKFQTIGQFSSLPEASQFSGRKIRNPDTGEIMQSDGEKWNPVSQENQNSGQ